MQNSTPPRSWMQRLWYPWIMIITFYCSYIVIAYAGLKFASTSIQVTPVWPLSGIVLGLLLRVGLRYSILVLVADFSVGLWLKTPPLVAFMISLGTMLEASIGAFLFQYFTSSRPTLTRLREVLALVGSTALIAIPLGASISTLSSIVGQGISLSEARNVWLIWYIGDLMGVLTITPAMLTWSVPLARPLKLATIIEVGVVWTILFVITIFVFTAELDYVFLLFPPLIWAAWRFGPRGATSFILTVSGLAIWFTARGTGPFILDTLTKNLLFLQMFLGVLTIVTLMLSALIAERDQHQQLEHFFAAFGALLDVNADEDHILQETAQLITTTFADWCLIDVFTANNGDQIKRVGLSGAPSIKPELFAELDQLPKEKMRLSLIAQHLVNTQQGIIVNTLNPMTLHDLFGEISAKKLAELKIRSLMAVPLNKDSLMLGYIVMLISQKAWQYRTDDLTFAQTLASRLTDVMLNNRRLEFSHEQQKFEALGRLAGHVAHDFNNLLTAISSSAELGLLATTHAEVREELEQILATTKRAQRLTQRILAFSRRQSYQATITHLHPLIEGVQPLLNRLLPTSIQADIHLNATHDLVSIDPEQFEQVLTNLIVNARDAMPNGGTLHITTRTITPDYFAFNAQQHDQEFLQLTVSDNGIGMDLATQARIFEPFFTTKASGQGTGFGLAMGYSFMQQAGGSISVHSQVGEGSTFLLNFPLLHELTTHPTVAVGNSNGNSH